MSNLELIPQPPPLPIIGNTRDMQGASRVESFLRLARTYGGIFRVQFFGRSVIVVSSQELVNELSDEKRFDKRVQGGVAQVRDFAGDGLFTAHTNEPNWAVAHRLLMPAFGPIGIRGMFDQMLDIADQMFTRWERFGASAPIDVADDMTRLTLDTIALCAFDYRFNSFYQNEMHPFVDAMVGALKEGGARSRRPAAATRMLVSGQRRYEADIRLMQETAETLIAERRSGPDAASKKDLLGIMLNGRDPMTGQGLSDENIRFQLATFLIAGHETTSGLLSFATYLLIKNPQVMVKARALVDEVLGGDMPRVEHLAKLGYIEQILMESLRIWPTAPAFTLQAREDTVIGGRYAIKASDSMIVYIPALHRDPEVWEDAESFKPERFETEAMAKLPPNAWKPFGNGQRACIGRPFAMQEAQLVMAMMLQRFDIFAVDPGYQLSIVESLTIKPGGFQIRAKRRSTSPSQLRSTLPPAPQRPMAPSSSPAASASAGAVMPLLVLYGSNTGSCEAFASRIASEAQGQGYAAVTAPLDDYAGAMPTSGAVVILTASYEGQPPDNAQQFVAWLDTVKPGHLKGVKYTVFGCGNHQWARTYQAIPKHIDTVMHAAGASRVKARGETDAGGDFFGAFDDWYGGLWSDLGQALGKQVQALPTGSQLQVERVDKGRSTILRQGEMAHGLVVVNQELVDMSSPLGRSKRHIEIELPQGANYRAGDYLAVLARNSPVMVERVLRRFGFAADSQVVIHKTLGSVTALPVEYPVNVSEILFNYVELAQPATRGQIEALAAAAPANAQALNSLTEASAYAGKILGPRVSVLDLLERFASCNLSFAAFLEMLPPMRARQYSISSSPLWNDRNCTLTLAVVDAPALSGHGRYQGVASSHLAASEPGARVSVAVKPSNAHFHPPQLPTTPMIMICAGTGLAPFRGFLQERYTQARAGQLVGAALLFFGCDHPDVDFLYREELSAWEAEGVVSVRPAFFRAPVGEVKFVQHRLWQDRAEVAALVRHGAHVYVCGDGRHMAPAVRDTCVRIYQEVKQSTPEEAEQWFDRIERETGRYVADVFA